MLRDPVRRAYGSYLAAVRSGRETRSFERLIRDHRAGIRFSEFLDLSRYHDHLTCYFEHFPRAQIAIHLFDDFRREPLPIVKQILVFVGVDPSTIELDTSVRYNRSGLPRRRALDLLTREHPLKERIKASLPLWARLQVVKLGTRINQINIVEPPLP